MTSPSAPDPAAPSNPRPDPKPRFRFKRKRPADDDAGPPSSSSSNTTSSHHRHRHHHSRHHRRKPPHPPSRDPSPAPGPPPLSPNAAFRESLFDALADDEGAAYWEGVYGQPVHEFSNMRATGGPDGELERMDDEEYARFVRGKMWERTNQGLLEERARRERERIRREEQRERGREEERGWRREEDKRERRLRRRERAEWTDTWEGYLNGWRRLMDEEERASGKPEDVIPWPAKTGRLRDVEAKAVEEFFLTASASGVEERSETEIAEALVRVLKLERVRWHPDKMLQRFGAEQLNEKVMKAVTAVFQVIDKLWNERKSK